MLEKRGVLHKEVTPGLVNGTTPCLLRCGNFLPAGTQGAVIVLQSVPVSTPITGRWILAQDIFQVLPEASTQTSFVNFVTPLMNHLRFSGG